jgi:hypothetical protein
LIRLSWKRWALFCLVSALAWFQVGTLLAEDVSEQNPQINLKVRALNGNYTRAGIALPLQIEVSNQGPDVRGKLRAGVFNSNNGPNYGTEYLVDAVVPQGSTKQFSLFVPVNEYMSSLKVELVTDQGTVAKGKGEFTFLGPEQLLVGLVDRNEDSFSSLHLAKLPTKLAPVLVSVKSSELSDMPESLSVYNALILDDINLKLKDTQAKALTEWVKKGGTLVVAGGPGWQKVIPNLPKELQQVEVVSTSKQVLGSIKGPVEIAAPKDRVDLALFKNSIEQSRYIQQGNPLVVEQAIGKGKVIFLAYDPALEPMASWQGGSTMWGDILGQQLTEKQIVSDQGKGGMVNNNLWALSNALNSIPAMDLPSLKRILGIVMLYILLAGVANYLILKKLDKREWTWATLPVLSLLFVMVIYFTSLQMKPSEVISNQLNIVDVSPNSNKAMLTTATGVFAPTQDNYKLKLKGQYLINGMPGQDPWTQTPGGQPEASIAVTENADTTEIELRKMRNWVMRSFLSSGSAELAGGIDAEMKYQNNKWTAVITNNTGYDFEDGVVLSNPFWFVKVGAIKSGQKLETEVPATSTRVSNQGPPFLYRIYDQSWNGQGGKPELNQRAMLKQQILGYFYESGTNMETVFLGWCNQPIKGAVEIGNASVKKYQTALFRVPLTVQFDKADLRVPAGVLKGKLISGKNAGVGGPAGSILAQPNSEFIYELKLPEGKFSQLTLTLSGDGNQGSVNWNGYLYNWQKEAWEKVMVNFGDNEIKDYAKYIDSHGRMRFKFENSQGVFSFYGISISLGNQGGSGQ